MRVNLNPKVIQGLKIDPSGKRREIADAIMPGLVFILQPTGRTSWAVRYRDREKKLVKVTLGSYPLISLADAREQAREVLLKVAKGGDPAAEKRVFKKIVFDDAPSRDRDLWWNVVEEYLRRDAAGMRSFDQKKGILTRATKALWSAKLIGEIRKRDVVAMLDRVADNSGPIAANRTLAHVKRVFNWAIGRDLLQSNPCDGIEQPGNERRRDRILTDGEIIDLWQAAETLGYPFGRMVQMLLLTGQRLREVAESEWSEFDLNEKLWTIPAARAKNDETHEVPLAPAVVEIIRDLPRIGSRPRFLFTTTGDTAVSGFTGAKGRLDAVMLSVMRERARKHGIKADDVNLNPWNFHDLRRTLASGMASLGVMFEVIERVLNHKGLSRSGVAAVYNRHGYLAEKRTALERWALHVDGLTHPRPGGVIAFPGGRRK